MLKKQHSKRFGRRFSLWARPMVVSLLAAGFFVHGYAGATEATSADLVIADLVIMGGTVYTVSDSLFENESGDQDESGAHDKSSDQAVAVKDGTIVFVGGSGEAEQWIGDQTEVIDLEGGMLLPGFIDTHNHVFEGVSSRPGDCDLSPDATLKEQIPFLKECKTRNPVKGRWITGYGHQFEALLGVHGQGNPREVLDQLFPDNPVVFMEESSHSVIVNSMALETVGFDNTMDHPVGGRFMYDETGELNGVLFDNAGDVVMEVAWNSRKNVFDMSYQGLLGGMEEVVSNGITTVGDGRLYWQRGWYEVWQKAKENEALIIRTALRPWIYPDVDMDTQLAFLKDVATPDINGLLVLNQVKLYIDGVLHFGTAKLLRPYKFSWQEGLPLGMNYIAPDKLPEWLVRLDAINLGAHIHALGDGGVRESLDGIAEARDKGSDQLYGMTHLEMVNEADFARFAQLDVDADFQAGAEFFEDTRWAAHYINAKRARKMIPIRGIYEAGANVTFSSDWTVNPLNPLLAISNSVKLKEGKGLPNVHEAIKASTINGAKALGLEAITGSIEVGKSADFVVLDQDILQLNWRDIRETNVLMTLLQGRVVFDDSQ